MFSLEHSDFSLVSNPDHPDPWRGVAHTQEGIKTLLALWGVPQNDPSHPLCVFSWSPCPEALDALKTHCPDACVRAFENRRSHQDAWDTQKKNAWLIRSENPEPLGFPCQCVDAHSTHTGSLWVSPAPDGGFPPRIEWVSPKGRQPLTVFKKKDPHRFVSPAAVFFWEPDTLSSLGTQGKTPMRFMFATPALAQRFRQTVLSWATLDTLLAVFGASWIGEAYCYPPTPRVSRDFVSTDAPWGVPTQIARMKAFFTRRVRAQNPMNVPESQWSLFRAQAQAFSVRAQKNAWKTELDGFPASVLPWKVSPQACTEHLMAWLMTPGRPSDDFDVRLRVRLGGEKAVRSALREGDAFLLDAVNCARSAAPERDFLWETPLKTMGALVDRHAGFVQWAHATQKTEAQDGVARWARTWAPTDMAGAVEDETSPDMRSALENPAFLAALENTGFWDTVESAPKRHPTWEAMWERQMLSGIHPPVLSGPHLARSTP
jgi:hypothetical protein